MTGSRPDAETIMGMVRAFQPACVIMAGAELGVFDVLHATPGTAAAAAAACESDLRATTVLLDALTALGMLVKQDGVYACSPGVAGVLTTSGADGQLYTARHLANCLRRWGQLARVVKTGVPAEPAPSILGAEGDTESFIEAMHDINRQDASRLVAQLELPPFTHLLDVGGGPATWTVAFLRRYPDVRATLFDLPDVLPIAARHLDVAGLTDRVALVAGDLNTDALPAGADLAWVSAIAHMNARGQNRALLRSVHSALAPGGTVLIRDLVMDATRTQPVMGALFAVNMLVATAGGGTFTFDEFREDLGAAGFGDVRLLNDEPTMSAVVAARKR